MLWLLISSFLLQALAQQCDPGWYQNEGFCYQYNKDSSQRGAYDVLAGRCKTIGAEIASGETVSEFNYLDSLSRQDVQTMSKTEIISNSKFQTGSTVYNSEEGGILQTCTSGQTEDTDHRREDHYNVIPLQTKPSCMNDSPCDKTFYRYFCKKKLCTVPNTEWRDGACRCDKDHVDSSQANRLRVTMLQSPSPSCSSLILLCERNWASLTEFLRLGSRLLPNKVRIGFIKYASNVSYTKWIQPGWSAKEFKNRVPYKFDGGETNTAEALDTATSMFKYQAAVLITDGLPFTAEYAQKKEEALALTKQAANRLLRDVNLIALGYGRDLHKSNGERYLKQLVEEPKSDYFEFHDDACDLKESDMSILLDKVCRRFL